MSASVDLTRFEKRSELASLACVGRDVAIVLAPVYLSAILGAGPSAVACWLWFGLAMNALLNLMHECAHLHTFRRRWASDFLGRWILGPLALADFDSYRERHWEHHRQFGLDGDTKDTYLVDVRGWRLLGLLLRCLLSIEGLRKFMRQGGRSAGGGKRSARLDVALLCMRTLLFQALFFGSLLLTAVGVRGAGGHPFAAAAFAYVAVYAYGLAALTVFAAHVRAIAEHQRGPDEAPVVGRAALRNFVTSPLTRFLIGAYGFAEHATHHAQPAIPYYHLPAATAELAAADAAMAPRRGYLGTLLLLIRRT